MKKELLAIIAILIMTLPTFGQAPEGFKYQALIRNGSNTILSNQTISLRMSIQQGYIGGTAVYTETFNTTTTNNGLVNLEIGTGTSSDDLANIDWSAGPFYIETAVDISGGSSYTVMGTSQLMSVPYALYSKTAENVVNDEVDDADNDPTNEIQDISFTDNELTITDGSTIDLSSIDTNLTEEEVDAFVSNNKTVRDILISPHMMANSTNITYPPGYNRQVVVCPGNGSTTSGNTQIDLPIPSDWDGTNMDVEIYYSAADTGNINLSYTTNPYAIGDSNYASTGAWTCVAVSSAYTLSKLTTTIYASQIDANDELMTLQFSRYDYDYSGNPCPDTVTGDVYIHGIRITYNANL